jgi:hypothetical protein
LAILRNIEAEVSIFPDCDYDASDLIARLEAVLAKKVIGKDETLSDQFYRESCQQQAEDKSTMDVTLALIAMDATDVTLALIAKKNKTKKPLPLSSGNVDGMGGLPNLIAVHS